MATSIKVCFISLVVLSSFAILMCASYFLAQSTAQLHPISKQDHSRFLNKLKDGQSGLINNSTGAVVSLPDPIPESMVLSLKYWEQTANALKNMLNLQCWAKTVNIGRVVEPSVNTHGKSVFNFITSNGSLTFRDLFDITHWNAMSMKQGLSTLESLEYFWKQAVRDYVFVHIKYELYPTTCPSMSLVRQRVWYKLLASKGFSLIKIVCINFADAHSHALSKESFRDRIFKSVGRNVTILFDTWRGIRKTERIALIERLCQNPLGYQIKWTNQRTPKIIYNPPNSTLWLVPSHRIAMLVDRFLSLYLPDHKYVAVMLRTGKLNAQIISEPPRRKFCANQTVSDWTRIVGGVAITQTLFFSDTGKHGSLGWKNSNATDLSQHVHDALNLDLSLEKVNSILETMAGSENPVLIAMLHQQLVAHATCVIAVGGGSFQAQALFMYSHLHRGKECYIVRDKQCERTYIGTIYDT